MNYIEIADGSVKGRNNFIKPDELTRYIHITRNTPLGELYHSVWIYDETVLHHFDKYKTIRSFRGSVGVDKIIFDIDKGVDTDEHVLLRARAFVKRLDDEWNIRPQELRLYYSGRGYHIYMPNYFHFKLGEHTRTEVKNTVKEYFPEVDLGIYGATGLIRAPYSYNKKSNRYKIPISAEEFFQQDSQYIMKLAESNQLREVPVSLDEIAKDFSGKIVLAQVEREAVRYRDEPTRIVTCMQKLFNRGSQEGSRHWDILRMTAAWRSQGVPKIAIIDLLTKWIPTLEKTEIERQVNDVFDKGYRFGCGDHIMSAFCDPKCVYFQHKNFNVGMLSTSQAEHILAKGIKEIPNKKYIDMQKILGLSFPYRIYQGEMVVFWGDTKVGKSTLVQNIVLSTTGLKFLYLPLENGISLDVRRMVQIAHGLTKEQVIEFYEQDKMGLTDAFDHVMWAEHSVGLDEYRKLIIDSECDVVVLDTIDQIQTGKITDYTQRTEFLANGLREITRTTGKTLLAVHHISKRASEDEDGNMKKLTLHSGKGSSAIEQKADKVIAIEGQRNGVLRTITSLGARDEGAFEKMVNFDKTTFRLTKVH